MDAAQNTPLDRLITVGLSLALAIVGIAIGLGLTLGAGFVVELAGVDLGIASLLVLTLVLTQGVAFGGVSLAFLTVTDRGRSFVGAAVPDARELLVTVGGYLLAFAAVFLGALLASGLSTLLGTDTTASNNVVEIGLESPEVLLLLIPFSFLLIGPGEELLFRGGVQGLLRERFDAVPAVVIASAIFASIHILALQGSLAGKLMAVGVLFFPSLVLGGLYEYTDNIVVPSLVHGAYNATLFLGLYLLIETEQFSELQDSALTLL